MTIAALRPNERHDIRALRNLEILDTEPEFEFDNLVQIAATACDAPIALISLIDTDRQWFKAQSGMPDAMQTSRDDSFCAHAVLGKEVFEVGDATADQRFATNPFVTGAPNVRFYAGAPLVTSGGACVGTICVIDREPRLLTETQRQLLQYLASSCVKALERRLAARKVAEAMAVIGESTSPRTKDSSGMGKESLRLVELALKTVDDAMQSLFESERKIPSPDSTCASSENQDAEPWSSHELRQFPAQPSQAAVQLCLTSTSALLGIVHSLIESDGVFTPLAREKLWRDLAADTKLAGRAAYRASLLLADPAANDTASWVAMQDSLDELRHQEHRRMTDAVNEPREVVLRRHWDQMRASGVTFAEFERFMAGQSGIPGIDVRYVFNDEDGAEQVFNFGVSDLTDANPMTKAISEKSLSRDRALQFAVTDRGRDWVESNFGTL